MSRGRVICTAVLLVGLLLGLWQLKAWLSTSAASRGATLGEEGFAEPGLTLFKPGNRKAAPDLGGPTLDGGAYELTQDRGHVVVVNIWGSWCGPCRVETPDLVRLANAYRSRGVRFVGVDTRDNDAAGRAFVKRFKVPYPSVIDKGSVTLSLRGVVPSAVVPSTFVVDESGDVAARVIGRVDYRTLRGILEDEVGSARAGGSS